MMFVFKWIDDLVGKGLSWYVVAELLLFASITMVPMALPLAVLLSSIMTFGNLGEHFELVACKAAGISLRKVMFPVFVFTIFVSLGAFYFSNYAIPTANLKIGALLFDIRQQKPAFKLTPGVFYNGIDGYVIKIGKKDADGETLRNLMIYDHTEGMGNKKLITAEWGTMTSTPDGRALIANLYAGNTYEERQQGKQEDHALMRTNFKEEVVRFDLTNFSLTRSNEALFKDNYQMLNVKQLSEARDSLQSKWDIQKANFHLLLDPSYFFRHDTLPHKTQIESKFTQSDFILNFDKANRTALLRGALDRARTMKIHISGTASDFENRQKLIARHDIEWHRKFTLSFACLVLFFVGAPLGAIIRKGGLGVPFIASVLLFIFYHVMSFTGEKLVRELVSPAFWGMWYSSLILFPVGVFLTYKATTDSALLDRDAYLKVYDRIVKFLTGKFSPK